jgi:hypothetical protein
MPGRITCCAFIKGIRKKPSVLRLVRGEPHVQGALKEKISAAFSEIVVERGGGKTSK